MSKGTIGRLMDRGYGFIKTEQGEDLFFHSNNLEGVEFNSLNEGQEVEFEKSRGQDGRPAAFKVRLTETQVDDSGDDKGDDDGGGGDDAGDSGDSGDEAVTAYLGLGSNLGDRRENLDKALDYLSQRMRLVKVSSVYDTEAVGNTEQPRFLNLVCQLSTRLAPAALLLLAKGIERKLGRQPGETNAPRPIDIDILFYGGEIVNSPELVIPHPRLAERAFVLVPLAEIAPELVHPPSGKTAKELLGELKNGIQGVLKLET